MTTVASSSHEANPLVVRTVPLDDPGPLLDLLPPGDSVAWLRRGEGLVGWGVAAVVRTSGGNRFTEAREWWISEARSAVIRDEVGLPGSGLVCFG
ncbi:MAG TPA: isochorismate synthase, partial [Nocardioidaceae bacterium]|nr:isochorismate synthase [Nocardioidaceae bacterium]